ncbi:DUF3888 domain-containing protein [Viridibacillus sp. NPDC096237]|uniref:DUF3888 domain-containing protein n=1 Tax=Viridibacillus sp. NPDC096237 TaxID=3390721 RepID=UPI003D013849
MIKQKLLAVSTFILFCTFVSQSAATSANKYAYEISRKDLLEEALLYQFAEYFNEITGGKAYGCQKILNIKRIEESSNRHEITAQLLTYEGAHNPPNDLYVIRFSVEPPGEGEAIEKAKFKIIKVDKTKNIPEEEILKICKKKTK